MNKSEHKFRPRHLTLRKMTWPEAKEAIEKVKMVIVPLGSCEQHGPHLPLDTDTTLGEEMAFRLAEKVGAVVLPTLPFGQVWSARDYPGTISLSPDTLKAILIDVCKSLYRHGVNRVVLLSGHLGNLPYLKEAAREVVDSGIEMTFWSFCYPNYKALSKGLMTTPFWNGSVFHAGELETSLLLAVAPDDCQMDKAVSEFPIVPPNYEFSPSSWKAISNSGVFGDARAATAQKGAEYIDRQVAFMAEVILSGLGDKKT